MNYDLETVKPEQVSQIQDSSLSFVEWSTTDKKYYSPDRTKVLGLKWVLEIPWGPSIYLAKLVENIQFGKTHTVRNFSSILLGRKKFIEPQDYRNPWSSDSKYIALVEVHSSNQVFKMNIYDVERDEVIPVIKHRGFFSYYAWSPDSKSYMFGDLKTIYQYSLITKEARVIHTATGQVTKHCYFNETGKLIFILMNSNNAMQVLSSETLAVLCEVSFAEYLEPNQTVDVSLWDPIGNRVILGVNMYAIDGKKVLCKKWLGIKLNN